MRALGYGVLLAVLLSGCSPSPSAARSGPYSAGAGTPTTSSGGSSTSGSSATGTGPSTSTSPSNPTVLGPAPASPARIDWADVSVPGAFCGVPGLVHLDQGHAVRDSRTHGRVHVDLVDGTATSGTMAGHTVGAAEFDCNNGSGTADGQLAFAEVVAHARGSDLVLDGELTPQYVPSGDVHTSLLGGLRFDRTGVTVTEHWYRKTDPTCCPSGTAHTRWTVTDHGLEPGPPHVSRA